MKKLQIALVMTDKGLMKRLSGKNIVNLIAVRGGVANRSW